MLSGEGAAGRRQAPRGERTHLDLGPCSPWPCCGTPAQQAAHGPIPGPVCIPVGTQLPQAEESAARSICVWCCHASLSPFAARTGRTSKSRNLACTGPGCVATFLWYRRPSRCEASRYSITSCTEIDTRYVTLSGTLFGPPGHGTRKTRLRKKNKSVRAQEKH